jgi:hypothetical protein
MLLEAIFLAIVVLVVVQIGPPFGAVGLIMALGGVFAAVDADDWRFLPAAFIGGLLVDLLIRLAPARRKAYVAGAASAAAFVLGTGLTAIITVGLGWSPSLLLGVALASAAIGWGLAGVIGRQAASEALAIDA